MTSIQGYTVGTIEKTAERRTAEKSQKPFLSFTLRCDDRQWGGKTYKGQRATVNVFNNIDEIEKRLVANAKVFVAGDIKARGYEYEGKLYGEVKISARTIEFESVPEKAPVNY